MGKLTQYVPRVGDMVPSFNLAVNGGGYYKVEHVDQAMTQALGLARMATQPMGAFSRAVLREAAQQFIEEYGP